MHAADTAREIYQNATLEKLAFLRHMNAREATLRKAEEASRAVLQVTWYRYTTSFTALIISLNRTYCLEWRNFVLLRRMHIQTRGS